MRLNEFTNISHKNEILNKVRALTFDDFVSLVKHDSLTLHNITFMLYGDKINEYFSNSAECFEYSITDKDDIKRLRTFFFDSINRFIKSFSNDAQEENGHLVLWRLLKHHNIQHLQNEIKKRGGNQGKYWTWIPMAKGDFARYGSIRPEKEHRIIIRALLEKVEDINFHETFLRMFDTKWSGECEINLKPSAHVISIQQNEDIH